MPKTCLQQKLEGSSGMFVSRWDGSRWVWEMSRTLPSGGTRHPRRSMEVSPDGKILKGELSFEEYGGVSYRTWEKLSDSSGLTFKQITPGILVGSAMSGNIVGASVRGFQIHMKEGQFLHVVFKRKGISPNTILSTRIIKDGVR